MDHRRATTIKEVREALLEIKALEEAGEAPAEGLTDKMREAVFKLQERMANLDKQWQRAIMLDTHGIFVYDDEGWNKGKPDVTLSPEAKKYNDRKVRNYSQERLRIMGQVEKPRLGQDPPPRIVLTARPSQASATASRGAASTRRSRSRLPLLGASVGCSAHSTMS